MEFQAVYTKNALKSLKKMPKALSKRIVDKVKFYRVQEDPLKFAERLTDPRFGEYRFRVGNYRIFFDVDRKKNLTILFILDVKHRKESYR